MKNILAACAVSLASLIVIPRLSVAAEILNLRDGTPQRAERFLYENGRFLPQGGATRDAIPRNAAQDWWLNPDVPAAPPSASAAPGAAAMTAVRPEPADVPIPPELAAARERAQALAARFPGCKGVQVLDAGIHRLTPDHRHIYQYHFIGLILNEELLAWGTINLGFTEGRGRATVRHARCLTPDNRVMDLDPASVNISRPGAGGEEFFDPNARELSATIPGAQVGALIDYEFEIETFSPEDWRLFFSSFFFQGDVPVCESTFEVWVPKNEPLHAWTANWESATTPWWAVWRWFQSPDAPEKRVVSLNGAAYRVHRWEKHDVPLLVQEPQMPPALEIAPAVFATPFASWDYLDNLVGNMQRERMAVTPELTALAQRLTAGATTPDAKAAALYHWVQKNIRYISIKSSLSSGWTGHPAAETVRNGYGDCTDKSILLATLLRCAGIEADPVVLRTNDAGLIFPRHPMLFCNHAITEARINGRTVYLDSTTQDYRYPSLRADDHGVLAINFIRRTRAVIPLPPGREASFKDSAEDFTVTPDLALAVTVTNRYAGAYEAGVRAGWKQISEPLRPQVMQQFIARSAPGAVLTGLQPADPQNLEIPFVVGYAYRVPDYVQRSGAIRVLTIPERERKFMEFGQDTRSTPVAYTTTEEVRRRITLRLPAGWTELAPFPDCELRNRHFRYRETWSRRPGAIEVTLDFERLSQRIPVDDYADCRRLLREIEALTRKPLFFQVNGQEPAAVRPAAASPGDPQSKH